MTTIEAAHALAGVETKLNTLRRAARVMSSPELLDIEIDLAEARREKLSRELRMPGLGVPLEEIAMMTASEFDIDVSRIYEKTRIRIFVWARHAAFYVAVLRGYSLKEIGKHFGRDHSTVINGRQKTRDRIETEPGFGEHMDNLIRRVSEA